MSVKKSLSKRVFGVLGCLAAVSSAVLLAKPDAGPSYKTAENWLRLPEGFQFGQITAAATDRHDNLYVFHRAKKPIIVFDKDGAYVRSWGDEHVKIAHGLRIDHDGNVWTTDLSTHQVIKYDAKGNVLLTLGTKGKAGVTTELFNKPADVAVAPAGEFYVADGYGNSRVVVFSKDGKFLREWGKKGKGPGEFNLPHAIFLDDKGRVYVGDRENNRVQVFDAMGKYLTEWKDTGAPYGLFLQKGERVLVADGRGNQVKVLDLHGKLLERWGMKGMTPGSFDLPHGICADSRGHIYVTEVAGKRLQKFVKS